ncbi:MAG: UDP-N-acetylmuramoyl-L-alanyl-D-glutamate--2,6-diaminopimelate ligase [Gammaproteobacteria bacterium]|nr:UDP-N-acetylmuramoyl-L-alanyl-D-glutamate--2,6-diaminopimelate ligase [Gammaproteobacteria bacterium]
MNALSRGLEVLLADAGLLPAEGSDGPDKLRLHVQGIMLDSRRIRPGEMFLALPGLLRDGRAFIGEAVARGAAVICVDGAVTAADREAAQGVPIFGIDDLDVVAGSLAAAYYDNPSRALKVLGVTGTNGKTSCSHHLAEMLQRLGATAGICGTLGNGFPGQLRSTGLTTADAVSLQRTLAWMRDSGANWVAMEVSSHALDQNRVAGITFSGALFTNLSRDHLDYHGSMAAYAESKRQLFLTPGLDVAVINRDDAYGCALMDRVPTPLDVLDFSLRDPAAAVHLTALARDDQGAHASVVSPWGRGELHTRLLGDFAVSNLLGCVTLLAGLGLPFAEVLGAADVTPVSGRMQPFAHPDGITLVVDYAHTPDALAKALAALHEYFSGQVLCVFGCGGERDPGKRPEMGREAIAAAGFVVITDDNPRSEDGDAIVRDILGGIPAGSAVAIERDRRRAIELALAQARPGDVVLIAGKGHEDYQDGPAGRVHYSDLETAAELTRGAPAHAGLGHGQG